MAALNRSMEYVVLLVLRQESSILVSSLYSYLTGVPESHPRPLQPNNATPLGLDSRSLVLCVFDHNYKVNKNANAALEG